MHGEELALAKTKAWDCRPIVTGGKFAETILPKRLKGPQLGGRGDQTTTCFLDRRLDAAGHCVQERIVICHDGSIREHPGGRQS